MPGFHCFIYIYVYLCAFTLVCIGFIPVCIGIAVLGAASPQFLTIDFDSGSATDYLHFNRGSSAHPIVLRVAGDPTGGIGTAAAGSYIDPKDDAWISLFYII
jgi:hypothetical protein